MARKMRSKKYNQEMGAVFKAAVALRGLTTHDVAMHFGVSVRRVERLYEGKRRPHACNGGWPTLIQLLEAVRHHEHGLPVGYVDQWRVVSVDATQNAETITFVSGLKELWIKPGEYRYSSREDGHDK